MNPATAVQSMPRPMVNDIAVPAPSPAAPRPLAEPLHRSAAPAPPPVAAQPLPPTPAVPPATQSFTTNLVTNIPLHDPQQAAPGKEDDELDKIMKDVGHELKKDDQSKKGGHFSLFSHKQKAAVPVAVQPTVAMPSAPAQSAAPVAKPTATSHPVKPTAAVKSKQAPTAPVMVVMVTVLVTGLLMAAAVYTYKFSL